MIVQRRGNRQKRQRLAALSRFHNCFGLFLLVFSAHASKLVCARKKRASFGCVCGMDGTFFLCSRKIGKSGSPFEAVQLAVTRCCSSPVLLPRSRDTLLPHSVTESNVQQYCHEKKAIWGRFQRRGVPARCCLVWLCFVVLLWVRWFLGWLCAACVPLKAKRW